MTNIFLTTTRLLFYRWRYYSERQFRNNVSRIFFFILNKKVKLYLKRFIKKQKCTNNVEFPTSLQFIFLIYSFTRGASLQGGLFFRKTNPPPAATRLLFGMRNGKRRRGFYKMKIVRAKAAASTVTSG